MKDGDLGTSFYPSLYKGMPIPVKDEGTDTGNYNLTLFSGKVGGLESEGDGSLCGREGEANRMEVR